MNFYEFDRDENGLIYLHNRYYDPRTGSFLTPDPVDGGGAQWNAYAYVNGNPINNIDPNGCSAILVAFAVGMAIDAGLQYLQCGEVDWGQAALSGVISAATAGLNKLAYAGKLGKLGAVMRSGFAGRMAVESGLDLTLSAGYDMAFRNASFGQAFQRNVVSSTVGNLIGEGIGEGVGAGFRSVGRAIGDTRIGQAIGNSRIGQTQLTPYEYHLLHGGSAIDSRGRVRTASRFGPDTGASLRKRRAWYSNNFNFREFNEQITRDIAWTERIQSYDSDFWLNKAWPERMNSSNLIEINGVLVEDPTVRYLFEARLQRNLHYPQIDDGVRYNRRSRRAHNQVANEQLYNFLQRNPEAAASLERMYEGVIKHVQPGGQGKFKDTSPPGLTWHHDSYKEGVLYLIDHNFHYNASGLVNEILHPNNKGGWIIWGQGQ